MNLKRDTVLVFLKEYFFELEEYWTESGLMVAPEDSDKECIDFHMVIVTEDDFEETKKYYMEEEGESLEEALEACESAGNYSDYDSKIIRYEFKTLEKLNLTYNEAVEISESVCRKIKDEVLPSFNLSNEFKASDIECFD